MGKFRVQVLVLLLLSGLAFAQRSEDLSGDGRFILEWIDDSTAGNIMFDLTVETMGYVGFGLSVDGRMSDADIVIGGIRENGSLYFSDRFGVGQTEPIVDDQQDWILVGASQNETHTKLKFYRLLDTGDAEQDIIIGADEISVIWAIGDNHEMEYHFRNRGSVQINLLSP